MEANEASTPGKKIWGRKRHLLVDTQGFPLAVKVHTVGISDREGAKLLLGTLQRGFARISHVFADHGYTGPLNDSRQNWVLVNGQPVQEPKPKGGFQV